MAQTRSEATKNRVLDAARDLLMEQGISELTMKDVQERSGVSNGSIFHHFGSKDGILEVSWTAVADVANTGAGLRSHFKQGDDSWVHAVSHLVYDPCALRPPARDKGVPMVSAEAVCQCAVSDDQA